LNMRTKALMLISLFLTLIIIKSTVSVFAEDVVATEAPVQQNQSLLPTDTPTDVVLPTDAPTDVQPTAIPTDIPVEVIPPTDVPPATDIPAATSIPSTDVPPVLPPSETPVTDAPTLLPTDLVPTAAPNAQPVGLPYFDSFDNPSAWAAVGSWVLDANGGYNGAGWAVNTSARGVTSTLQLNAPVILSANSPQLSFWYRGQLAASDTIAIDADLDGSGNWAAIREFNGLELNNPGWTLQNIDLSIITGLTARLRVRVNAGSSDASTGFWIDELTIQQVTPTAIPTMPVEATTAAPVALPTLVPTATLPVGLPGTTIGVPTQSTPITLSNPEESSALVVPSNGNGLTGEYFDDANFSVPVLTRIDPTVNFNWGTGRPERSIDSETFSIRWTGKVAPRYTETYTFYTTSDDGVRLWINDQLIIDHWGTHSAAEDRASISLTAGQQYNLRMEYYDNTNRAVMKLAWSSPSQRKEVIPQSQLYSTSDTTVESNRLAVSDPVIAAPLASSSVMQLAAVVGTGTGLKGDYFDNANMTNWLAARTDATVNFNWTGAPVAGMGADTFAVRWTGQVQAQYSETYTFYTVSDDGIHLWVNGQPLVNNWTDHTSTQNSGTITLVAGQKYNISIEYYQNVSGATAQLWWSSPSQPKQIVPQSQLFPTTGAIATAVPPTATPIIPSTATLIAPTTVVSTLVPATATTVAAGTVGTGTGLKAEYFDNANMTNFLVSRVDPTINFNWNGASPAPGVAGDTFAVRWTGQIQPRYSQTYTFYTVSDDGIHLWVNGQHLVNNWTDHSATENSGTIALVAGQKYNVTIEYYQNVSGNTAQLWWSSPSQPKQIIPQTQMYSTMGTAPTPISPTATTVPATSTPRPTTMPATSTPMPTTVPATSTPRPTTMPATSTPVPTTVPVTGVSVPFNANSIWNRRIPANVVVHPNSRNMINLLSTTVNGTINIDGITGAWSVPVYEAPAGTPLQQVCDSNYYRGCEMVPIPSNFIPSPDGDAKSVIIDRSVNPPRAWSFWLMTPGDGSNGQWTVGRGAYGWANISTGGDGIRNYDGGEWGGRVSSWNYYAGLIRPEEIRAGRINHALHFNVPTSIAARTHVWPARGGDGQSYDPNAIPVGSWIQLDPSIDVNTLNLSPSGKILARAMQEYGMWIGDTGSMAAVNAQEFVRRNSSGQPYVDSSPWSGLLTYRDIYNFPIGSLRVLQPNPTDFFLEP
jgi:hypothetical protein